MVDFFLLLEQANLFSILLKALFQQCWQEPWADIPLFLRPNWAVKHFTGPTSTVKSPIAWRLPREARALLFFPRTKELSRQSHVRRGQRFLASISVARSVERLTTLRAGRLGQLGHLIFLKQEWWGLLDIKASRCRTWPKTWDLNYNLS